MVNASRLVGLLLILLWGAAPAKAQTTTYTNCTVTVTGGNITVACPSTPPPPALACTVVTSSAAIQVGVPFTLDVSGQCSGGVKPYTFAAVNFQPGITISPAGIISGTPQTAGTFTLTWKATDSATAQGFERRIILDAAKTDFHLARSADR